ncbi:MAG: 23S rRNA (adenine(2030)-N(6))-methyltransferase RlmJ [Opitutales bacterium]
MNYRHQFHAGNFADVMKHVLLVQLVKAMQRKEKGFLYLDTHAGRGSYDLAAAARGDTLARQPEWPAGIGRLWSRPAPTEAIGEYLALVRDFDRQQGSRDEVPRFYPGSPALVRLRLRPQDRMVVCERQPDECSALRAEMARTPGCLVQGMDGYTGLRAALPPKEKRALVLVDPPFEGQTEFADLVCAVQDGLKRLPGGTYAIWYPLTERARLEVFFGQLAALDLPPTAVLELAVAGDASELKMRGCGLVVLNPPWQWEAIAKPSLLALAEILRQGEGACGSWQWLVPER